MTNLQKISQTNLKIKAAQIDKDHEPTDIYKSFMFIKDSLRYYNDIMKKPLILALISTLAFSSAATASPSTTDKDYLSDFRESAPRVSEFSTDITDDIDSNPGAYIIMAYRTCRLLSNGMSDDDLKRYQASFLTGKTYRQKETLASSFGILTVLAPKYYCPEFSK